jgi:hemerythrin-like domain-containing protein/quercetin dioxygenase-like cupin family protein
MQPYILQTLVACARNADTKSPSVRSLLSKYVAFCRGFVDEIHHGKEESLLFARMCASGFPRDEGPIGVMLQEHEVGRGAVGAMDAIAKGEGPLNDAELANLGEQARAFADLLARHIAKENTVLYPMASRAISADQMEILDGEARAFDQERWSRKGDLLDLAATLTGSLPSGSKQRSARPGVVSRATDAPGILGAAAGEAVRFEDLVEYQSGTIVSRTLAKKNGGTVTLFAFDAGQGLSEHTAPFDAWAYVLDGWVNVTVDGHSVRVDAGQGVLMPGGLPHALQAVERFKMMLVMVRQV